MRGTDNAFSAMTALSLLILFNIATLLGYFELIDDSNIEKFKKPLIVFAIMILVINYFIFIHKNRFEKIANKFVNETKEQKRNSSIIAIAYAILTFVFLFLVLFFK